MQNSYLHTHRDFLLLSAPQNVTTSIRSKVEKEKEIGLGCPCWMYWFIFSCRRSSPWDSSFTFGFRMAEKTRKWTRTISQHLVGKDYRPFCESWKDHSPNKGLFALYTEGMIGLYRKCAVKPHFELHCTQRYHRLLINSPYFWLF